MVSPNFFFFIKIVSAVFVIFRQKEAKKPLISCTITILDHTLYGKLKRISLSECDSNIDMIIDYTEHVEMKYRLIGLSKKINCFRLLVTCRKQHCFYFETYSFIELDHLHFSPAVPIDSVLIQLKKEKPSSRHLKDERCSKPTGF